jgi:cellulose synthase/poly-beta-1,6-N-acetylglucosamine synthase-like glycosyltransferase
MIPFDPLYLLFFVILLYDFYYFGIFLYQSFKKNSIHFSPSISVIVPVYNGESTIRKCIQSIINSEYNIAELIVVNDGSTDKTKEVLESFGDEIIALDIPHSGKAAALNHGIQHALYDIVTVDADTVVESDAIKMLVRNLKVYDAVAGNLQVLNKKGFLGRSQAVEHVRVAMFRKVAHYFDEVDIVPGPIGAFKKDIFSHIRYGTSVVEDMELTQKLREETYTIGYEQKARAYTKMPVTWKTFWRQRFRWAKGNVELVVQRKTPVKKVIPGYLLALADVLLVVICLIHQYMGLLVLFFSFESVTMLIGNYREKTDCFVESVFFPFFMLFFDCIFLLSHVAGILSVLKRS